jgi:hypothetical protein
MHADFPVSIDLEIAMPEVEMSTKGKKQRKIYPTLFVSGASGLEGLPREGYALIHFKRRSLTMGDRDGEDMTSAELEIHEIRLPEKGSDEEMGDIGDALKSMAKDRGLIETDEVEDEDEEMEEETEEAESLADAMVEEDEDEEK